MLFRRQWIPPWALLVAQLSHGTSWILLVFGAAWFGVRGVTPAAIAWIHVVALGWVTMAALAILLHVIPGFTDLRWRGESLARAALGGFAIGVALFILGWLAWEPLVLAGAVTIALSLTAYLSAAFTTLGSRAPIERSERTIARGLTIVLALFAAVVVLGLGMVAALFGGAPGAWLAHLPAAHAALGIFGWFTILIVGVAARTMRPICGVRSTDARVHAFVGVALTLGAPLLALGLALANGACTWGGAALIGAGALAYATDAFGVLRRATVTHRPPQAFVGAALLWLLAGLALGVGVLRGAPWGDAFVFVMLIGWVGQMVNAHMLHIGVRTIATMVRGDDDETRPNELLGTARSWFAFGAMQLAVLLGAIGLMRGDAGNAIAAGLVGAAAWLVMSANLLGAYFAAFDGTKTSASPSMQ